MRIGASMGFYSAEGLRTVALLLDHLLDVQKPFTQNYFAELTGIAPNTIKNLRSNRSNTDGIGYRPDPDTLIALVPYLKHPETGEPLTEDELIRLARGQIKITPPQFTAIEDSEPPLAAFLRKEMKTRQLSESEFSKAVGIKSLEFRQILQGRIPSWVELLKLGAFLFPNKNPAPLLPLLGIDPTSPVKQKEACKSGR